MPPAAARAKRRHVMRAREERNDDADATIVCAKTIMLPRGARYLPY